MESAPMPMSRSQASLRGRMGAYATLARHDRHEINAKARQVFRESFANAIRELHPELDEDEVQRRAEADRRLFYAGLALKSAKVRARRKSRKANRQNKPDAHEPLPADPPHAGGELVGEGSGSAQSRVDS